MLDFLVSIPILIVSWLTYKWFKNWYEEQILGLPPVVGNSWVAFLTGNSLNARQIVKKGYEEYSKKGLPFRYYEGFGNPHYIIPPSHFASVGRQKDTVLGSVEANEQGLVISPFLGDTYSDIVPLVRTTITNSINAMLPAILLEIQASMRQYFPSSMSAKHPAIVADGKNWTPTNIHKATLSTVARVITRILLGKKFADDPVFTDLIRDFAHGIVFQALLLRLLPTFITRAIAPYFNTSKRVKKIGEYVRSDIVALLRAHSSAEFQEQNNDDLLILPMLVKYVRSQERYRNKTEDELVDLIQGRLLGLAFATVDTTTITITHVMHELLSFPYAEYSGPILEQAHDVKARNGGQWRVKTLSELTRLDSLVKEVQRLRPVGYLLSKRLVMCDGGVVIRPSAGPLDLPGFEGEPDGTKEVEIYVPKGGTMLMPLWGIHSDPNVYEEPEKFRGFRFVEDKVVSGQPTDKWLSFGHGRHACPGRHLALTIIKLFVIEFLETMECMEGQPKLKTWDFEGACVADMDSTILIRRLDQEPRWA